MSGLIIFEAGGLLGFKNFLFIAKSFVVPSLNVVTKTNLGFILFSLLCHDIFFAIKLRLGPSFVATEQECRDIKM